MNRRQSVWMLSNLTFKASGEKLIGTIPKQWTTTTYCYDVTIKLFYCSRRLFNNYCTHTTQPLQCFSSHSYHCFSSFPPPDAMFCHSMVLLTIVDIAFIISIIAAWQAWHNHDIIAFRNKQRPGGFISGGWRCR